MKEIINQSEWERDWNYVCDKCGRREIEKAITRSKRGHQILVLRCQHCGHIKREHPTAVSKTFSGGPGRKPHQISKERTL